MPAYLCPERADGCRYNNVVVCHMKKRQSRWVHLLTIFLFNLEPPEGSKYLNNNLIPIWLPFFQSNSVQGGKKKKKKKSTFSSGFCLPLCEPENVSCLLGDGKCNQNGRR